MQRYRDVTLEGLRALGIRALVISGNATVCDKYDASVLAELHRIIRAAEWPIIGFCGGHQQIAVAHGAELGPMRPLRPGEPDLTDLSGPGYLKEWGFMPVSVWRKTPFSQG